MGGLHLPVVEPNTYSSLLHNTNMGCRRPKYIQESFLEQLLPLWIWVGRSRTVAGPLFAFAAFCPSMGVRVVRHCAYPAIGGLSGHALLALPQLSHVMELSLGNDSYLACLLLRQAFLPQLDKPLADVLVDRRRSGNHGPAGERRESHNTHTSEMDAWPIRLPTNAGYLRFREPPIHRLIVVQQRLPLGVRRGIPGHDLGLPPFRWFHSQSPRYSREEWTDENLSRLCRWTLWRNAP